MIRTSLTLLAAKACLATVFAAAPLRVVTLSTVLTEIVASVGGDEASVTGLVRPGVDPHSFEPAPSDLRALDAADVVLAGGFGLETYLDRLTAHSGTHARIVDASLSLRDLQPAAGQGRTGEPDPHWWNSIPAMIRVTRQVAAEFTALRPAGAAGFQARADAYAAGLQALDEWARAQVAVIPPARRQLVTTHDAFGWFSRDYGFTVHSISGRNPGAEPNARELARLIDYIRSEKIPAIFVETSSNAKLVATVSRETGARPGGSLYADGLAPDGEAATYAGMFRHNVRTIVEALRPALP